MHGELINSADLVKISVEKLTKEREEQEAKEALQKKTNRQAEEQMRLFQ